MRFQCTCFSAGCLVVLVFVLVNSKSVAVGQTANGIFVAPITGEPFTAISIMDQEVTKTDGSKFRLKSSRSFARDSLGRVYKEIRALEPFDQNDTPRLLMVVIYDPQTRIYTYLYPDAKVYWQGTLEVPTSMLAREYFYGWSARYGSVVKSTEQQDLGTQTLDDVAVNGVRQIETISERPGSGIVEIDEYWYSDELGMNLVAKCSQPDKMDLTVRVIRITRTEPDAALFQIPRDYKKKEPYTPEVVAER